MAKRGIFEREWIVMVGSFLALPVLGLIATMIEPHVINLLGNANTDAALLQVERLRSNLDLYRVDTGTYPAKAAGLRALLERPPNAEGWNGPYVETPAQLTDPWGRPYRYRYPGKHGEFDLYSLGREGREGGDGEDRDVTSWD